MSFRALLAALALVPGLVAAAELGRLTVLSGVGEPLRAEVEILAVRPGEAASLLARIPPPDVFWRANLEPSPALDRIRVRVERRAKDRYVVVLRTNEPFEDPFLQLLVELTSSAGNVVREYPFLLDEPRARGPRDGPAPTLPQTRTEPPPEAMAQPAPALESSGGYVVRPGDTLATIAQRLRPTTATLDQTIVALYRANEHAFLDRNMNRLRAGEVLAMPPEDAVLAVEPENARGVLLEHRAAFDESRKRPTETPARAAEGPASGTKEPTARATPGDRLELSRSEGGKGGIGARAGTAREDDVAALQGALGEAKERIALLEKNLEDVRQLLVLKNRELARLERNARAAAEALPPLPGDAGADDGAAEGRSSLGRFLSGYGAWLLIAFLLGLVTWIVMPFKTARLWLRKRRRRQRAARRAAQRVRREALKAGLLSSG